MKDKYGNSKICKMTQVQSIQKLQPHCLNSNSALFRVQFQAWAKEYFLFFKMSKLALGPTQPRIPHVPGKLKATS